jgi:hypothetical protein
MIQRPMRFVPAYDYQAVRHDNIASSGVRETIYERTDTFLEFTMEWVSSNPIVSGLASDLDNWNTFVTYALQGGQFQFFPDSALSAYTNYWLEDTNWKPGYKEPGQYTFKMRWRLVVS